MHLTTYPKPTFEVVSSIKRPKIVIVAGQFPARSETFVKNHVLRLAERGYQVSVVSCGPGKDIYPEELSEINRIVQNISIAQLDGPRFQKLFSLLNVYIRHPGMIRYALGASPWTRLEMLVAHGIWAAIEQLEPDIVHVHFGSKAGPLFRYRKPHCTTVVTWHGYDSNHLPNVRGDKMYEALMALPLVHTVGSEFMCRRLEYLGAAPERINQIPMGIDTEYFSYKARNLWKNTPLRILSVGRLDEMKGHTYLVEAINQLLEEGEQIELRIIGSGPLQQQLEAQIESTQFSAVLQLLGAKTSREVLAEMHWASLFCLTGVESTSGRVETQGVVLAEAQATGLPVVATSVGGVSGSLIDGSTGILCRSGDIPDIKRAIRFYIRNRNAIGQFGREGRRFIESNFSLKSMVDAFETIYGCSDVTDVADQCCGPM